MTVACTASGFGIKVIGNGFGSTAGPKKSDRLVVLQSDDRITRTLDTPKLTTILKPDTPEGNP